MPVTTIKEHTLLSHPLGPHSVVLDLGANAGVFSTAMVRRFGCTCYAVEPNPAMAARIDDDPRIHVRPFAMSGEAGEATFHVSADPLGSSLHPIDETDYPEAITVPTESLAGLMARETLSQVDLVKADIEGAEIPMFDACPDAVLQQVDQYTVEFHDFNGTTPESVVRSTLDRFRDLGFVVYKKSRLSYCDVLIFHPDRVDVSAAEMLWVRTGRHYLTGLGRLAKKAVGLG
ncbi:FkbM family methyltransferase [Rubrivirga sp. IMCC43871]|uniref:FkbM family methyltransferase n=1 Tax=Rubrivirga sp. IMCC43871 TaxID=3391575 RepID=UPI00399011B2